MISPPIAEPHARHRDLVEASGATAWRFRRYAACLRLPDILALQGSPLLGAVLAVTDPHLLRGKTWATLLVGNVLLMAHVFLLNDWAGLRLDRADPNRSASVFTARGVSRREIAGIAVALLLASLLCLARLGSVPLALAAGIAALSALYSLPAFDAKGKPLLGTAAHLAGGTLHFLLGYSMGGTLDGRGFALAAFFALTFAAGHVTQEVRDHAGDRQSAVRTNAVRFGPRRAFIAGVGLFGLAHAVLVALALGGALPRPLALAPFLFLLQLRWSRDAVAAGLTYAAVSRLQWRYRALYASLGALMVGAVWLG